MHVRSDSPHSSQAGFSMLELLLALFVIAFVLLPIIAMELQITRQGDRAEVQTRALLAGQGKLEELMATPYDELASGSDTVSLGGQRALSRTWQIDLDQPRAEMATILVVVQEAEADGNGSGSVPPTRFTAAIRDQ